MQNWQWIDNTPNGNLNCGIAPIDVNDLGCGVWDIAGQGNNIQPEYVHASWSS